MKHKLPLILFLLVFHVQVIHSQESVAEAPVSLQIQRHEEILRFGIDEEIRELIDELISDDISIHSETLAQIFASTRNTELRESLLRYFTHFQSPLIQGPVIEILGNPRLQQLPYNLALMDYLVSIESTEAFTLFRDMLDENSEDVNLSITAIRALGRLRATREGAYLLGLYEDLTIEETLRSDILWALGEMRYSDSLELMTEVLENPDEEINRRQIAAEALGKIGSPESVAILLEFAADENELLRNRILQSLGNYPEDERVPPVLLAALRNNSPTTRGIAAESLGKIAYGDALDHLVYRTRNDPDSTVRERSIKALQDIGGPDVDALFFELMENERLSSNVWKEMVTYLLEHQSEMVLPRLSEIISRENSQLVPFLSLRMGEILTNRRRQAEIPLEPLCLLLLGSRHYQVQEISLRTIQFMEIADRFVPELVRLRDGSSHPVVRNRARAILQSLEEENNNDESSSDTPVSE